MVRRRYFGPKRSKKLPKGYDSMLEVRLHDGPLKDWDFHKTKVSYKIEHNYSPDFEIQGPNKKYLLESKGRFMDMREAAKYIWIREALEDDVELIFVFERGNLPLPGARIRKRCKTKRTHGEWADSNGFMWFDEKDLPENLTLEYL